MSRGQHRRYTRTGLGVAAIATGSAFAVVPAVLTGAFSPGSHHDPVSAAGWTATAVPGQFAAAPASEIDYPGGVALAASDSDDSTSSSPAGQTADDSSTTPAAQATDDTSSTSADQSSDDSDGTKGKHDKHGKHHKHSKHHKHHKHGKHHKKDDSQQCNNDD